MVTQCAKFVHSTNPSADDKTVTGTTISALQSLHNTHRACIRTNISIYWRFGGRALKSRRATGSLPPSPLDPGLGWYPSPYTKFRKTRVHHRERRVTYTKGGPRSGPTMPAYCGIILTILLRRKQALRRDDDGIGRSGKPRKYQHTFHRIAGHSNLQTPEH